MSGIRPLWLILVLAACGGDSTGPDDGNPSASADVAMTSSNTFSPSTVTIISTGTVTWNNSSGVGHNVTFGQVAGSPTNVQTFTTGSASRTFGTAGTFPYTCTIHPGMSGQVVVQ